jgi:phosphatidylinositol glycan class V
VAAALHVLSPAGIFLAAPYSESTFAFLNFAGLYLYCISFRASRLSPFLQDACHGLSGVIFGLATTVRSNGLFNGTMFLGDAFVWAWTVWQNKRLSIRRPSIIATISGGLSVGLGFVIPQYIAFQEFCHLPQTDQPPWCNALPPSIYSYVQSRYW